MCARQNDDVVLTIRSEKLSAQARGEAASTIGLYCIEKETAATQLEGRHCLPSLESDWRPDNHVPPPGTSVATRGAHAEQTTHVAPRKPSWHHKRGNDTV